MTKLKCNKLKVEIKKYNFYEGRTQKLVKRISKNEFNEIKSWQKSHPEFKNAYSIKIMEKCKK